MGITRIDLFEGFAFSQPIAEVFMRVIEAIYFLK
jgi:hypothetical protein